MQSNNPESLQLDDTQIIFNNYFKEQISYNSNDVSAVVTYFLKRGFDRLSAINTAAIFLQQAKIDNVPVFKLLDTMKGFNDVEINNVISQILNLYRPKTSVIGFKKNSVLSLYEQRNIIV